MLWAVTTRRALLRSKRWSVIHPCFDWNFRRLRQLVTTRGARRRYDPRRTTTTTWLDLDPSGTIHGIPPDNASDSTRVPIQEPQIWPVHQNIGVNRLGKLMLGSTTSSEARGSAVLVVSAASKHLTKTDFTRLLAAEDRAEQGGITGALITVSSQRVQG
jgi:hypothetical protein